MTSSQHGRTAQTPEQTAPATPPPTARIAMISGANRGIGAAIARLAQEGWQLSIGVRQPESVPAALRTASTLVYPYDANVVGSEKAWTDATVARFGRIDALINNAGIMIPKSVIEADDDDLDAVLNVNVKGPLRVARAAWPYLEQSGRGRVVTVVSLSGKRVKSVSAGLYSISKFAALALSHALRQTGWDKGIRSTALCPGFVATDMAASLTEMPAEQMTQPEDLATMVSMVLNLPNSASVAELCVNGLSEPSF